MDCVLEKIKDIPVGIIVTQNTNNNSYNHICSNKFIHHALTMDLVNCIESRQESIINKNVDPRCYIIINGYDIYTKYKDLVVKLLSERKCKCITSILIINSDQDNFVEIKKYFDYVFRQNNNL